MKRSGRMRRRHMNALLDISMTPLIDTALTLLIIFMITTPIIQNAIRVSLPKGALKEDEGGTQELVIYVDKESRLFLNGQERKTEELIAFIKERISEQKTSLGGSPEERVYVKADQTASYGAVIELVDRLKSVGGVSHVILATERA